MRWMLVALSSDEFAPYRAARLKPLSDAGNTLPRLLARISEDQAVQARISRQAILHRAKTEGLDAQNRDVLQQQEFIRLQVELERLRQEAVRLRLSTEQDVSTLTRHFQQAMKEKGDMP